MGIPPLQPGNRCLSVSLRRLSNSIGSSLRNRMGRSRLNNCRRSERDWPLALALKGPPDARVRIGPARGRPDCRTRWNWRVAFGVATAGGLAIRVPGWGARQPGAAELNFAMKSKGVFAVAPAGARSRVKAGWISRRAHGGPRKRRCANTGAGGAAGSQLCSACVSFHRQCQHWFRAGHIANDGSEHRNRLNCTILDASAAVRWRTTLCLQPRWPGLGSARRWLPPYCRLPTPCVARPGWQRPDKCKTRGAMNYAATGAVRRPRQCVLCCGDAARPFPPCLTLALTRTDPGVLMRSDPPG